MELGVDVCVTSAHAFKMLIIIVITDLKEGHHQVSYTQVDHEHMHGCVVLPPLQQHPQDEAVAQCGEGQHHPEHRNLRPGQAYVPDPGLRHSLRCGGGGGTIVGKDPKKGSPAVRSVVWAQI